MKRRFTILTAALALLAFLAIPMGMRGQTRTTQTAFYGFETGDAGWTATSFVTNNTAITAHGGSKYGATNGSTATLKYNNIVDSPQSLTCYVSKTSNNTTTSTWYIQVSTDGTTWTNVSSQSATSMSKGEWVEFTADLSSYSNVYIQIKYDGTIAVRALDDITLIYDDGNTPSTDPEITFTPASITLDEVLVGNEVSATFSVAQANLTSSITLSVDNGSLSTSSIAQGAAATTVTWTYTPTTAGAISATVTATSGTTTETLAISGTAIAPIEGYDVDFEYPADMYPNWTFDNMTTYQTGSITAHDGTYYGTTGGKATASITTASTVANPGTLTCYVSKQSGNTTSSTWYIQVSENGSTWTDVESHSATSMSQGSWVEFTADLTDYTDVYVRVYYSGSTAIRNIDDLTLTTVEPSSAVATTTTINVPQNFNTDIYQGTNAGTLTATVKDNENNVISGATVTWESSNTNVATIDANGAVTLVAVGTTTITASYAGIDDQYRPSQATYTLEVTSSAPVVDYATLPFAYDGNGTDNLPNGFTVSGLGTYSSSPAMKFDGTGDYAILKFNERPGTLTFDIKGNGFSGGTFTVQTSEDGVTYTDLETYTVLGDTQSKEFTNLGENVRYIKWIYTSKSSGNVALGNIKLAAYVAPELYNLTVSLSDNVSAIFVYDANNQNNPLIAGGAAGTVQVLERTSIMISPDVAEGYVLETLMVNNENVISELDESGAYTFTMPANEVIISATAVEYVAPTDYALYNNDELVEGDYIIYYDGYVLMNTAMGSTNRLGYATVNPSSDIISTNDARIVWHIAQSGDYWTIYNAAVEMYAASTGTKNQAQMLTDGTDDKALWTVTPTMNEYDEYVYEFVNKKNAANNVNANLRNNSNNGWACYSTSTGGALSLYKKVEPYTKDIVGNTWYFISSPTGTAPTNLDDLSDLYYYDEQDHYWRNKEVAANANGFDFGYGKGYLCANADPTLQTTPETVSLSFTGDLLTGDTYNVPVTYNATTSEGDNNLLAGWNLVGNPFNSNATLNMDCYTISGNAINMTAYTAGSYTVAPCTGVMVKATGANQNVIFTKSSQASQLKQLEMTVAQQVMSRGTATSMVHDNAIVNFNAGSQLEKFPFNADAAELYIPQDGKDYAIVSSEAQGEMPVNFKAKENGTYTLSINPEGVEMNYLHLIDNKTGNDVDLLQTPSYTFEAKVNDYESRFRLVFAANNNNEDGPSTGSGTFAFYSNGSWIINNAGEATLQVVDLTGRILSSETVNGSVSKTINAVPGVYMLCLINGENVNVQKIVVR